MVTVSTLAKIDTFVTLVKGFRVPTMAAVGTVAAVVKVYIVLTIFRRCYSCKSC